MECGDIMGSYEEAVSREVKDWLYQMRKKSRLWKRTSKQAQDKFNGLIPEKAHYLITDAIKHMVKATLWGSEYTTKRPSQIVVTLQEQDEKLTETLIKYRNTASVEGAGTGAVGFIGGLADFPLLLSIKMKFLFEAAMIYGFDTSEYEERLFLLHIFQLAFSSDDKRRETMDIIEDWENRKAELVDMDWQVFQQEYRDHIDLIKMLQMIPGIGAVVGAYANFHLLEQLGAVAKNAYRLRRIQQNN